MAIRAIGRLGELLIREHLITPSQLEQALDEQKRTGERLGSVLVRLGFTDEDTLTEFLSEQYGVPSINLTHFEIEDQVLRLISADIARKYDLIPISRTGATLTVAMVDPSNVFAMDDIKFMTGYHVEPVVTSEAALREALTRYYGSGKAMVKAMPGASPAMASTPGGNNNLGVGSFAAARPSSTGLDIESLGQFSAVEEEPTIDIGDFDELISGAIDEVEVVKETDDDMSPIEEVDAPIIKLVNGILLKAIKQTVSDIHIEPYEKSYRVRYRLDGVLHRELSLPIEIRNAITSRVKIMANLDISERRLPQDGRIKMKLGRNRDMDFRVSTVPTLFGEKVVLRLLDKSNLQLDMTKLGFDEWQMAKFTEAIHSPYGMVLVTGPTGSGKTTTLYSALHQLNQITENIMTAEDPVEYNLSGINQVQMKDSIGLNFAAALRSFLRQDPDIVMVGEIRDFETAEIAIKAALTGHLVLSTLHTNDAPSTVNRLLNMGIEPFLVSSSTVLILAQRLARKICKDCKEPHEVPPEALIDLGFDPEDAKSFTPQRGRGCATCNNKGYKGRIAVYEVMPITDDLRELIVRGATNLELREAARAIGMKTLRESGLQRIKEGVTSIEEVVRVTFGN